MKFAEDVQPGYAPKEISFRGYTTKNFHHTADAAKAFQETIGRVGETSPNEILTALKATDTFMKLNDVHLNQGVLPDEREMARWKVAHDMARSSLQQVGEFMHHMDYWHAHEHELQDMLGNYNLETAGAEMADSYEPQGNSLTEEKHRVQVTVSDPNHPAVSLRKVKSQRFVKIPGAHSKESALDTAKKYYKKMGLKVHSVEHTGMVSEQKSHLPPHLQKLIKDKQLDKKPMTMVTPSQKEKLKATVKDATPKGYGPNEEADLSKIDTPTLRHIAALHRRNADKDPKAKEAAEAGEAELKRREVKEEVELEEAVKLGSKVKIHAPGKDYHEKVGHVGEIRHGAYKGAPKTYTVDYDHNPTTGYSKSVQLDKKHVKLHTEEVELDESLKTHYQNGYDAQKKGKSRQDNPHREGSPAASMWAKGWEHASDKREPQKFANEEFDLDEEQLDELSKDTVASYAGKAGRTLGGNIQALSKAKEIGQLSYPQKSADQVKTTLKKSIANRKAGLDRAEKRLSENEEVETVQEELHRVNVSLSDPNHQMASQRKEKIQKIVKLKALDKEHALSKAKQYYKNRGYKVHDAEHIGVVNEELTDKTIKSGDKIKVARVIADMLGVEGAESMSPEMAVNAGLRGIKNKRMTPELIGVIGKMLKLAQEVGLKYDSKLVPRAVSEAVELPDVEVMDDEEDDGIPHHTAVAHSLVGDQNMADLTKRHMKVKYHMEESDLEQSVLDEIDADLSDEELDHIANQVDDEDDILHLYDDEELAVVDDDTQDVVDVPSAVVNENMLSEVLSRAARIRARVRFTQTQARRTARLRIVLKRRSDIKTLTKRAHRLAIHMLKERIAKKPVEQMSVSEKERVENILQTRKAMISRMAMRLLPRIRQIEQDRMTHHSTEQAPTK